jgi:predicted metal-binding protein
MPQGMVERIAVTLVSPSGSWHATVYRQTVPVDAVAVDYARSEAQCASGCPNYGRRCCCPPHSPPLKRLAEHRRWFHVVALRMPLAQLSADTHLYHQVRMANAMLKSRLQRGVRWWRKLEPEAIGLGSGACRACNPCAGKRGAECAKPEVRMYSPEAVGVDCEELAAEHLGFELEWYGRGDECSHAAVIGGMLSDRVESSRIDELVRAMRDGPSL